MKLENRRIILALVVSIFFSLNSWSQENSENVSSPIFQPEYQAEYEKFSADDKKIIDELFGEFKEKITTHYNQLSKYGIDQKKMYPICSDFYSDEDTLMLAYFTEFYHIAEKILKLDMISTELSLFLLKINTNILEDEIEKDNTILTGLDLDLNPRLFPVGDKTRVSMMSRRPGTDGYTIVPWREIQYLQNENLENDQFYLLSYLRTRVTNQIFAQSFPLPDYTCWDKVEYLALARIPSEVKQGLQTSYLIPKSDTVLYAFATLPVIVSTERKVQTPFHEILIEDLDQTSAFFFGVGSTFPTGHELSPAKLGNSPDQWIAVVTDGGYHYVGNEHFQILIKNSDYEN